MPGQRYEIQALPRVKAAASYRCFGFGAIILPTFGAQEV